MLTDQRTNIISTIFTHNQSAILHCLELSFVHNQDKLIIFRIEKPQFKM